MHKYKNLKVWQKSVSLATNIYELTKAFPQEERFGITSQIRRAVVSISSNIAEGAGRASRKEFAQFLSIAYGSCYELDTQLLISNNIGFLSDEELKNIEDLTNEIQKMIYKLRDSLVDVV